MLTGRTFDASEALNIRLVVDVVPNDVLVEAAYRKAEEIISNSAIGVGLTKEAMWTVLEIPGMHAAIDLENRQQVMASYLSEVRDKMKVSMRARTRQASTGD